MISRVKEQKRFQVNLLKARKAGIRKNLSMAPTKGKSKDSSEDESKKPKKPTTNKIGQSTSKTDASVIRELKALYNGKLLPIERDYMFHKV